MHPDAVTELPTLERAWINAWRAKDRAACKSSRHGTGPLPDATARQSWP